MPNLGYYQPAFDVVREADLLDAYDFDRSMIYHMQKNTKSIEEAYHDAYSLFQNRVFKHADDKLLLTNYAIRKHPELKQTAMVRIENWRKILERNAY